MRRVAPKSGRSDVSLDAVADEHRTLPLRSYRIALEYDGTGAITVEQIKDIPSVISLEIGEFLYQLRAALDACVYELACVTSGD